MSKVCFITENDFKLFIQNLIKKKTVIGPMAKKSEFVFNELTHVDQLRLDYDVTILPPKKAIMPPKQDLVKFDGKQAVSCIDPQPQILMGVHFYDIKAIDMLDDLFERENPDQNYLANRKAITLIGSNIQKVSKRSFFGSVGPNVEPKGHDGFITKIGDGYVFDCLTQKAEDLLSFGTFTPATKEMIQAAEKVNQDVKKVCAEQLEYSTEEIAEKVRKTFNNQRLWKELSKACFSCGTCNIVCPTCYCFDVQDEWELDQVSTKRYRTWDGCLLRDFSKISLGGGKEENFRDSVASRFRHRIMRKTTYLNDILGGPACVGCGRCSSGCVPDIADPVDIIHKIMGADNG